MPVCVRACVCACVCDLVDIADDGVDIVGGHANAEELEPPPQLRARQQAVAVEVEGAEGVEGLEAARGDALPDRREDGAELEVLVPAGCSR